MKNEDGDILNKFVNEADSYKGRFTALNQSFNIPQLLKSVQKNSNSQESKDVVIKLRELVSDFFEAVLRNNVSSDEDIKIKFSRVGDAIKQNFESAKNILKAKGGTEDLLEDMKKLQNNCNKYWD